MWNRGAKPPERMQINTSSIAPDHRSTCVSPTKFELSKLIRSRVHNHLCGTRGGTPIDQLASGKRPTAVSTPRSAALETCSLPRIWCGSVGIASKPDVRLIISHAAYPTRVRIDPESNSLLPFHQRSRGSLLVQRRVKPPSAHRRSSSALPALQEGTRRRSPSQWRKRATPRRSTGSARRKRRSRRRSGNWWLRSSSPA